MGKGGGKIGYLTRRRLLAIFSALLSLRFVTPGLASESDDPRSPLARPAIGLSPKPGAKSKSHFGGLPTVPRDFEWPSYNGKALDFLLEVDLGEISGLRSDLDLPGTGRLLFFYLTIDQKWGFDPADRGCSRVYWFETSDGHVKVSPPDRKPLPEVPIEPGQQSIMPAPYSHHLDALGLSEDAVSALFDKTYAPTAAHLGGFPFLVQDDTMELESEATAAGVYAGAGFGDWIGKVDAKSIREHWQLLLQVPSLDGLDIMWGDSGFLYFWIRRDDLARRDFSRVWLILQSY